MGDLKARHLGLGVDCGGTYTDAVVYDLDSGDVLASCKFPTTHHDLTLCIDGVLDGLPPVLMRESALACLSTTLATNAMVEGRGGRACLILLGYDPTIGVSAFGSKVIRLGGGHDVRGEEMDPLDEQGLHEAARANADWADAFAVSSYFSVRNPEHEMKARSIITSETGKPVVCGHELSMQLDAPRRATTASVNARLIPLITGLIASVKSILESRKVSCPLMVVRGDGTLMGAEMALERPVETILSGPAASVVGALKLSGRDEGVVIDIGGTTTDIAWVTGGTPPINSEGAVVGDLATRVEAIDIRTIGLGGDSWVKPSRDDAFELGPRRVVPVALLPQADYVKRELEKVVTSRVRWFVPDLLTFWFGTGEATGPPANSVEARILERLDRGPLSHLEIKTSEYGPDAYLRLLNMENQGAVIRASLTLTDIFNAAGESRVGDVELSKAVVEAASRLAGISSHELTRSVKLKARDVIAKQALVFLLDLKRVEEPLLERWMRGGIDRGVRLNLGLETAILAAGAPAALFLEPVASLLSCECVIPPHMEVANAVGAVAGVVSHREEVIIRRQHDDSYRAFASDGRYDFLDLNSATDAASRKAAELASATARAAGAGEIELDERVEDFTVTDPGGDPTTLERTITMRAFGRPRLREVNPF